MVPEVGDGDDGTNAANTTSTMQTTATAFRVRGLLLMLTTSYTCDAGSLSDRTQPEQYIAAWPSVCVPLAWRCRVGLLLALIIALMILSLPTWPYAAAWGYGYYPSGGLGILLLVVLILLLSRRRV